MTNPLSSDLIAFGAVYTPAQVGPGQAFWQLIEATGPMDIGGNHAIFVEVLDRNGQRLIGVRVRFWNGGTVYKATEPKPGENYALDFPIFAAGNAYGVQIADAHPSDTIFGLGLVAFEKHVSYRLVFRYNPGDAVVTPPVQPLTALQAIEQAERYLTLAKGLL